MKNLPKVTVNIKSLEDKSTFETVGEGLQNIKDKYLGMPYLPGRTDRLIATDVYYLASYFKLKDGKRLNEPLYKHTNYLHTYLGDFTHIVFDHKTCNLGVTYYDLYVNVKLGNNNKVRSVELIARYGDLCNNYSRDIYDYNFPKEENYCLRNEVFAEIFKRYNKQ